MPETQPRDDSLNPSNWTGATYDDGSGVTLSSSVPPATPGGPPAPQGTDLTALAQGMGGIQRQGEKEVQGARDDLLGTLKDDSTRQHQAYNAEVATSHDIPSWNEEQQRQKFSTDPVKAFGSMGSVFALIASAFTHRPMINALQGSAAAMDAIKAGDDKEYDRAFTAYKTNVDLALKRHEMMHQEYQDARELMTTDLAAGKVREQMIAAKFQDKQLLFLRENGLDEMADKLFLNREKAKEALQQTQQADMDYKYREQAFSTDARVASGDPQQVLAAWQQYHGKTAPTAEQTAVANYVSTTKPPTNEQELEKYNKGLEDLHKKFAVAGLRAGQPGTQIGYLTTRVPELMEEHKDDPAYTVSNAQLEAAEEWKKNQAQFTKEGRVDKRAEEIRKENPGMSIGKAHEQARIESVSGGKNLTKPEMADRVNGPDLIDAMTTLREVSDVTGITTGKLSELAAKYGTVNDRAAIWAAAHIKAEAALAAYEGSGKTSLKAMQIALDRIPKVYQSTGFNNKVIADSLQSFTSQLQTSLNAQESEGKPLDEETLDKFNKVGVFPQSQAQRDPVQVLRKNPTALSLDQLSELRSRANQLTPADRKALIAIIAQKAKEWDANNKPKATPAAPAAAPLDPALESVVE